MQFLTIREFSKAPKTALSKLAQDGKAVLTNNGKPAAIMITVDTANFEKVFNLVQEVEKRSSIHVHLPVSNDKDRSEAFDRLINYPRKDLPLDFNYKKELLDSIDERYGSIN